jgi:hypothetical protein
VCPFGLPGGAARADQLRGPLDRDQGPEPSLPGVHGVAPSSPDSCRVDLFFSIPNNRDLALEIVAHEMFHCLQGHSLKYPQAWEADGSYYSYSWWAEGSATALASRVAPNGHAELADGNAYRPDLPLFHQPRPYATVLFWDAMFLNEGMTYAAFANLIKNQPLASNFASERAALSNYPGMDSMFHNFARHYTLKDIRNVTGTVYNPPVVKFGEPIVFESTWDHMEQPIVPFTVNTGAIRFPSGTHLMWGLSSAAVDQKVKLSYRMKGDNFWVEMGQGTDREIQIDCGKPDGETYEYVLTSTADSAQPVSGMMTLKNVEAKECFCKDTSQPLDPCLKGNWELDDQALSNYYTQTFTMYKRVDVSGKVVFKLAGGANVDSTGVFEQFRTYILMAQGDGGTMDAEAIADGSMNMKVLMQKKGEVCFRPGTATGTYRQRFGGGSFVNGSLAELLRPDPSAPELHWQYTCDKQQLHMSFNAGDGLVLQWLLNRVP